MTVNFGLGGGFNPSRFDAFQDLARRADAGGVKMVMTGDSPALAGDCYVGLALLAQATSHCQVSSCVTNAVTRHPVVTAAAISTIDALSGGRAVLGIGSGNSGVYNLGGKPAPLSDLEDYITALRSLWTRGEAQYRGQTLHMSWGGGKAIPVYISAGGPKGLHMAGRIADGVYIEAGLTKEVVDDTLARLAAGAAEAGRSLDDIQVWWTVRGVFADSLQDAIVQDHSGLSGLGVRLSRGDRDSKFVPDDIKPRLDALKARFSILDHGEIAEGASSVPLVEELGLGQYLVDRFAIAGNPDDWIRRIEHLASIGVRNIALGSSTKDRAGFVDLLTSKVIPAFA